MQYFKVTMSSEYYCGFDCEGYFKAEDELDIYEQQAYQNFRDEMVDYVSCSVDEDEFEENEGADAILEMTEEITEEEYLEGMSYNSEEKPYHVG